MLDLEAGNPDQFWKEGEGFDGGRNSKVGFGWIHLDRAGGGCAEMTNRPGREMIPAGGSNGSQTPFLRQAPSWDEDNNPQKQDVKCTSSLF